jgi:hypothetical protein
MVEVHQATLDSTSVHMTHKRCSLHRQNRPHPCRYRTSTTSFWIVQHICFYCFVFLGACTVPLRKNVRTFSVKIWRPSSNIHRNIPLEFASLYSQILQDSTRLDFKYVYMLLFYASTVKFCLLNNFMVLFPFRCTNLTKILLIYYKWIVDLHVKNYIFYILYCWLLVRVIPSCHVIITESHSLNYRVNFNIIYEMSIKFWNTYILNNWRTSRLPQLLKHIKIIYHTT